MFTPLPWYLISTTLWLSTLVFTKLFMAHHSLKRHFKVSLYIKKPHSFFQRLTRCQFPPVEPKNIKLLSRFGISATHSQVFVGPLPTKCGYPTNRIKGEIRKEEQGIYMWYMDNVYVSGKTVVSKTKTSILLDLLIWLVLYRPCTVCELGIFAQCPVPYKFVSFFTSIVGRMRTCLLVTTVLTLVYDSLYCIHVGLTLTHLSILVLT